MVPMGRDENKVGPMIIPYSDLIHIKDYST